MICPIDLKQCELNEVCSIDNDACPRFLKDNESEYDAELDVDMSVEMKTLNDIADAVHQLAWDKGWHSETEEEDAFIERACNNLHDEISELHEAWRNNRLRKPCDKAQHMIDSGLRPLDCVEEEFADIIIRVLDNCKKLGVDIQQAVEIKHNYNKTRLPRHGGKRS